MRVSPEDVARIPVLSNNIDLRTGQATTVPLAQVADIRAGVDRSRSNGAAWNGRSRFRRVAPGYSMGTVADAARDTIARIGLPTGYRPVFGGDVQNLEETKGYVLEALVLAVVFILSDPCFVIRLVCCSPIDHAGIALSFLGVALGLLVMVVRST